MKYTLAEPITNRYRAHKDGEDYVLMLYLLETIHLQTEEENLFLFAVNTSSNSLPIRV